MLHTSSRVSDTGGFRTLYHDGCEDTMVRTLRDAGLEPQTGLFLSYAGGAYP